MVEPRAEIFQNARVAMALLTADLRAACPLPGDSAFLGMTADGRRSRGGQPGFCDAQLHAAPRARRRFLRGKLLPRARPGNRPVQSMAPAQSDARARSVVRRQQGRNRARTFSACVLNIFDGTDWYDNWGEVEGKAKAENSQREQNNLSGLPEAVRITLLLDSNPKSKTDPQTGEAQPEPPLVFQTVVRLNLADAAQDDTGNSSGQSVSDTQNGGVN